MFNYISEIVPEKDANGTIIEYYPQKYYKNATTAKLHKHGKGPYCKFKFPADLNVAGVYVIKVEDVIKYIGECENLSNRFNTGYGNISPRNCFVGGQATNCKINSSILKEIKKGHKVYLYFKETEDRFLLEREMIGKFNPEWNSTAGKAINRPQITNMKKGTRNMKGGKYEPLKYYLTSCSNDIVELSYEEIEKIIENNLPMSAHKYIAWWANGGHSQADAWLDAGYRVESVKLGHSVVFMK